MIQEGWMEKGKHLSWNTCTFQVVIFDEEKMDCWNECGATPTWQSRLKNVGVENVGKLGFRLFNSFRFYVSCNFDLNPTVWLLNLNKTKSGLFLKWVYGQSCFSWYLWSVFVSLLPTSHGTLMCISALFLVHRTNLEPAEADWMIVCHSQVTWQN